jgi:hypothetical protein
MLGLEKYITEENGRFYLDVLEWNERSDISIEEKDIVRFILNGKKYVAKAVSCGSKSLGVLELSILNNG